MKQSRSGFTIVELLIVIVVIGILAAISIVAYNGVQDRARNAQQFATARAYMSAFASYVAVNGQYPPVISSRICLGIDQNMCVTNTSWVRDTTNLEPALKTIISTVPTANASIPLGASPRMGYVPVSDVTLDGVPSPFLIYTVIAPATCSAGTPASGPWPNFSSTPPSQGYTYIDGPTRVCLVPLPTA